MGQERRDRLGEVARERELAVMARGVDHIIVRKTGVQPAAVRLGELDQHHIRTTPSRCEIGTKVTVIARDHIEPASAHQRSGAPDHTIALKQYP